MSDSTPVMAFDAELPSAGPWWSSDPEEPPAGAVVVADLISRHGGTERQGWAFVYQCANTPPCAESFGVSPPDAQQPTMCACCGGPMRLHRPCI